MAGLVESVFDVITQIKYLESLALPDEILRPRACRCRRIQLEDYISY